MCFGEWNCKFIQMYGVESVAANNWNFNNNAAYGTIGMSPNSFIWEGFIDPVTKQALYSIELARESPLGSGAVGSDDIKTNITFGSANDDYY